MDASSALRADAGERGQEVFGGRVIVESHQAEAGRQDPFGGCQNVKPARVALRKLAEDPLVDGFLRLLA